MKSQQKVSKVRIIGGEHKRRFITFVNANGLRPTPDRLRETIFNWLQPFVNQACVLDACAGSGAFGIECLSRGAEQAIFIEPNKRQITALQNSLKDLQLTDRAITLGQKAEQAFNQLDAYKPFDIIFIDPPYSLNLWNSLLQKLFDVNLHHEDTLIYIEADKHHEQLGIELEIFQRLTLVKEKKVGQIFAGLYSITQNT